MAKMSSKPRWEAEGIYHDISSLELYTSTDPVPLVQALELQRLKFFQAMGKGQKSENYDLH